MSGDLLTGLTDQESDRLWWRLIRAVAAVSDEVEALTLAPVTVREALYGDGCLESYTAMAGELAALAAELADSPLSRITVLRDDTLEEGSPQWHDSDDPKPSSMTIRFALLLRRQATRSARRLMPRR